ncbi:MAG: class I SAM-dependent methyltransferase [Cyanobium sp.]
MSFRTYMEWVLHDPEHGYYGSGRARIGPGGDFATSPSLGDEFGALLLPQVIEWLEQLPEQQLSLVEAGPGEGQLAAQLAHGLADQRPDLAGRTELVLVEPNPGMAARQASALAESPLPVRWATWDLLQSSPVCGVVIAHEVLDALAVERITWDGLAWHWQHVALRDGGLRLEAGPVLRPEELAALPFLEAAQEERAPGWCSEVHTGLGPWFLASAGAISTGVLLVMDYALEAWRYYAPSRLQGTLLAYQEQRAIPNPLMAPGEMDLTAHLCLEVVAGAASAVGWDLMGARRQGEALLALGLAQRLSALSQSKALRLSEGLQRREQLLRLVDPLATGDFRWLMFHRGPSGSTAGQRPVSRCLSDPPL